MMRILIVTNDSPQSDPALGLGAQLARRAGEPPLLLKVIEPTAECCPPSAEEALADARQILGMPEAPVKIRIGYRDQEIVREAEEGGYDLVVLSGVISSRFLCFFRRDPVVKIAGRLPCSVLIAKGEISPVRRILLCDSGAAHASTLSRFTAQLADVIEGDEEIIVLHVMSQISAGPGIRGAQLRADAETLMREHTPEGAVLARDVETLKQSGLYPTPKVRHGLVVDEILAEARSSDYNLVVIGAHRYEGWQGFLLDDLSRKIVSRLDRPVLVVK